MSDLRLLIEEIRKSREALAKIEAFCDRTLAAVRQEGRTEERAIVLADLFAKYYTCLETIFLRISQFFENGLIETRWHMDLLSKMTLRIEGEREAVVGDATRDVLLEFLKFRHFTRYYYDISYDWDRLDYLTKKFAALRPALTVDFDNFLRFLAALEHER